MISAVMAQASNAISIGSRVRVTRVRDRIPATLVATLKDDPTGTVTDFKMTDATGVGVVVTLSNGSSCWFFEDEITTA